MPKLTRDMRVLCVCRMGQVRSVATRYLLADRHGFRRVLACGWQLNDRETLEALCEWADVVLVVGQPSQWELGMVPERKRVDLEIGPDVYGNYRHPELLKLLASRIEELL